MAISAQFTADFSQFTEAAKGAEAALGGVQAEATKVDRTVDAFGKTATTASGSTKQWSTAISQVDSLLGQVGINIGQTGKALDEVAAASGKTASQLGAVATAGLVVGTAMAAWNFGRAIAGWLDLDKSIGNATASLLGWGNLAAETSGAKQDAINAAIAKGGENIRTYADAVAYLTEWQKKRIAATKEMLDADIKSGEAWAELNSAGATYAETLTTMNAVDVEAIKGYLANGAQQSVLAAAYGYTAAQIRAVADAMADVIAKDKAWLDGMKAAAAEADLYASVLTGVLAKAITDMAAADAKATVAITQQTDARVKSILAEQTARDTLAAKWTGQTDALTAAWQTMQAQLAALSREQVGNIDTTARQQVIWDTYTHAVDQANGVLGQAPAAIRPVTTELEKTTAAANAAIAAFGQFSGLQFPTQGSVPTFVPGAGGGGQWTNPYGAGALGGAAMQPGVTNYINVNGTAEDTARKVAAEILRTMKASGKVASS